MSKTYIPAHYHTPLNVYEMQRAIEFIKSNFQVNLSNALNLRRVSAPLFVEENSGLNDNLNGVERPVSFDIPDVGHNAQVVQSLAKWKRLALKKYEYRSAAKRNPQAIRSFEELRECVSGRTSVENKVEERRIEQLIDAFLWQQREETRTVFLRRYWYFDSIDAISKYTGHSQGKIKSMLFRTRQKLRKYLESEGVSL